MSKLKTLAKGFEEEIEGRLFIDGMGRLYIDTCETADEHMNAPITPGSDRRRCRRYLEDSFSTLIGKRGRFTISVLLNSVKGESVE
jgi:hypothetical protein